MTPIATWPTAAAMTGFPDGRSARGTSTEAHQRVGAAAKRTACDTPANLKRRVQKFPIFELSLAPGANGAAELGQLSGVHQATRAETPTTVELKVALEEEAAIGAVVQTVVTRGGKILTLKKVEPTLEDVFIELVGHGLEEGEPGASATG